MYEIIVANLCKIL